MPNRTVMGTAPPSSGGFVNTPLVLAAVELLFASGAQAA